MTCVCVCHHLSGSSKRMVAAQWKTMLMQLASFSASWGLMARPGCVSSLLMGTILRWKSGSSSRTRSKSCGDGKQSGAE